MVWRKIQSRLWWAQKLAVDDRVVRWDTRVLWIPVRPELRR